MIPIQQLEQELQAINPSVRIVENQNRPGISNVMLNGQDICIGLCSGGLQEEHSSAYMYTFPNGMSAPFKTYSEAKEISLKMLNSLKDEQFAKDFFDTDYAIPDDTQYK